MSVRNYRPLQMHRIAYTDLTEAQVTQLLKPAASGPASKSPFSNALAGKHIKIVTADGGPTLEYTFKNARELELSENGGKAIKAGYGALEDRSLVLVSHLIPGTHRGFNLVVDPETRLATVFEIYFNGYAADETAAAAAANPKRQPQFKNGRRNREVQRKIWFGHLDGAGAPLGKHVFTNRMEGRGIYWKQDNDIEILEFYLTVSYSNLIELTRFGGEMTVCAPSDYIMVNDHQFIYSRVECEFTGTFTLQLIDLFDTTQKGVRLGLTDKDELEYYMYSGKGEITGQTATFEVFGNNSETRGPRRVYRPIETFETMTDDDVKQQVLNHAVTFGDGQGTGAASMGGYRSELITKFVGKQLSVKMDNGGPAIDYDFTDAKHLKWRYHGDSNWREARYEMYEPDNELYFFAHLLDAEFPRSCAMVALDVKNGLSTVVKGTTGTAFRNNETHPTYYFGVLNMEGGPTPPTYLRHGWTDEMVGQCVTWNYQPGNPGLTSMHFYATPNTYSWIIFNPDGSGGMQWSSPGWYSKLRDGVYIMAWVEEACNGTLGVICFNQRLMHDAGFGYHVGRGGLSLSSIGARARHAGKFEIGDYVGIKT
ncbi:MAG TPA: MoaF N-terminal domain-containing protein [Steroidobacteraceae bacterium]